MFELSERVKKAGIKVVLIQIDEAHSSAWPMALDNQPEPQSIFQDRIDSANRFVSDYDPPYDVYIDGWDNVFANTFRAWPDKYHCVDENLKIVSKADYHGDDDGNKEAVVIEDYVVLLKRLMRLTV